MVFCHPITFFVIVFILAASLISAMLSLHYYQHGTFEPVDAESNASDNTAKAWLISVFGIFTVIVLGLLLLVCALEEDKIKVV
jgi:biotin transporter BioY